MKFVTSSLLIAIVFTAGCASLHNGSRETIAAQSDPAGADVEIFCSTQRVAAGVTPAQLTMRRADDYCEVVFTKEGFVTSRVPLDRGFSGGLWADIAMTCALGIAPGFYIGGRYDVGGTAAVIGTAGAASWIYDRATGAMYRHIPATVRVNLRPLTGSEPTNRHDAPRSSRTGAARCRSRC